MYCILQDKGHSRSSAMTLFNRSHIIPISFYMFYLVPFLQRVRTALNAERRNSQRDSVSPSVCPSRSGIVSRLMKIRSCGFSIW